MNQEQEKQIAKTGLFTQKQYAEVRGVSQAVVSREIKRMGLKPVVVGDRGAKLYSLEQFKSLKLEEPVLAPQNSVLAPQNSVLAPTHAKSAIQKQEIEWKLLKHLSLANRYEFLAKFIKLCEEYGITATHGYVSPIEFKVFGDANE